MQVIQDSELLIPELTGALDINTVEDVRKVLLTHLKQHSSIAIDLSSVESCDAAGAQLLLALEKSAECAGKPFTVLAVSEALARDCANLGITIAPSAATPSSKDRLQNIETINPKNLAKKRQAKKVGVGADA
jgi:anti-anti-sigma factor